MQRRLFLNVVVRERAAILQLLSSEDQTLLIRRDSFLILDLLLSADTMQAARMRSALVAASVEARAELCPNSLLAGWRALPPSDLLDGLDRVRRLDIEGDRLAYKRATHKCSSISNAASVKEMQRQQRAGWRIGERAMCLVLPYP